MPLYTYSCTSCGIKFERLARATLRDEQKCSTCGSKAERAGVDEFAVKSTIDPKSKVVQTGKEIDLVVGRDAERRRAIYEDKRRARREGMTVIDTQVSAGKGNSFNPEAALGDSDRKAVTEQHTKAVKSGDPAVQSSWLSSADLSKDKNFRKLSK